MPQLTIVAACRSPTRYSAKTAFATMLRIVIFFLTSTATLAQAQDWLKYVRGLGLGERLAEIRSVSELSKAAQRDRVSALIHLLKDEDQSVRLTAAAEIAEMRDVSAVALPGLIENFQQPHGEEGMGYVGAAAAFGEQALPLLQQALGSSNWLVRARACDAIRKIKPNCTKMANANKSAMTAIASSKLLFVTSVIAGGAVWAVFAEFKTEPWDSPYGGIAVAGLGLAFGFLGKGNPMLWPLGIFLGEVLVGLGDYLKGSVVGFAIRKAKNGA